jgi:hypothetical protein
MLIPMTWSSAAPPPSDDAASIDMFAPFPSSPTR